MRYNIIGTPFPAVKCDLQAGEVMITQSGAMCWMSPNMKMETTSNGGIGKALGRFLSGETLFLNRYSPQGGDGHIAFAASFPGVIRAFEITPANPLIVQKRSFLAGTLGLDISISFRKKFGAGLFGGEGFIMQKIAGTGMVFVEIDGHCEEYVLAEQQQLVVDTGYVAAMEASCTLDIVSVPGVKNALFGGEGLFNTIVTGPGKVYLQTMPVSSLAGSIAPFIVTS